MSQMAASTVGEILAWPGRVVSAQEFTRLWRGQRRLAVQPGTVLTPSALEELKARGVAVERQSPAASKNTASCAVAQEAPWAVVEAALAALQRDGRPLTRLPERGAKNESAWAVELGRLVAGGARAAVFCRNAGLVSCLANKIKGVRAAVANTPAQLGAVVAALAPNLVAVDMPGRTLHEIRQTLSALMHIKPPPAELAATLKELEADAHR